MDIRVTTIVPDQEPLAYREMSCYILKFQDGRTCPIGAGECRYGLTEIVAPERCPLRKGPVSIEVSLAQEAAKGETS